MANVSTTEEEPSSFTKALKLPVWKHAMVDEFNALLQHNTWCLTPLPPNKNIVGCKWVYRIKRNPDRSIARYKARIVKGYH